MIARATGFDPVMALGAFVSACVLLISTSVAIAATPMTPVNARDDDDRSLVAIVSDIDTVICSGTVIGPRQVLTAASCVIAPETGEPLEDRQVMARLDLVNGYVPAPRHFIERIYLPGPQAPFGPGNRTERQLAIIEVAESEGQPAFSEITDKVGLHYGQASDDEGLKTRFFNGITGGQMRSAGCAALAIESGDVMPLTCALAQGAVGAALRSASGIAGIYLGPGLGRYIGKAEQEDIGRIVSGLQPQNFRAIEMSSPSFVTFVLANACDQPISYVARYRPVAAAKDQPFSVISGTIDAGLSAILPLKTENGVIYLRGFTENGGLVWGGDHRFDGESYLKITIPEWGDHFHALSCGE